MFTEKIILDLEAIAEDDEGFIRQMAIATFTNALENPSGKGDPE